MNQCQYMGCGGERVSKGYCSMHYQRLRRYGRLERISTDWIALGEKPVYHTDKVVRNALTLKYMHKKRFGGMRETVLERDHYRCTECGMTRREHKDLWGKDLTINHIDKKGRYSIEQNNDLANLETLCLRCHSSIDSMRHGKYAAYKIKRDLDRGVIV